MYLVARKRIVANFMVENRESGCSRRQVIVEIAGEA